MKQTHWTIFALFRARKQIEICQLKQIFDETIYKTKLQRVKKKSPLVITQLF